MREFFESLVSGIERRLAAEPGVPNPRKKMAREIGRVGARLFAVDDPLVWCGVLVPFEILHAMDLNASFVEMVGASLSSSGAVGSMLDSAEQSGYGTDGCAYHRSVLGAASSGLLPAPACSVATSAPCSGGVAVLEEVARLSHTELMVLHVPANDSDNAVAQLARQLQHMQDFVARCSGRKADPQRLREACEKSNQARELMAQVYTLAAQAPSPLKNKDLANFAINMGLLLGTDQAIDVAAAFRDELQQRKPNPSGDAERLRLMWLQNRVQFKNPMLDLLQEHGARVVVDELNDVTWEPLDPDEPFIGMARRIIQHPLAGSTARRIQHLRELAARYQVHGAINPCHWGCRQGTGARGLVARGLQEHGVPVLDLEVDCVDPRSFAMGQLKTRLEAFLEML